MPPSAPSQLLEHRGTSAPARASALCILRALLSGPLGPDPATKAAFAAAGGPAAAVRALRRGDAPWAAHAHAAGALHAWLAPHQPGIAGGGSGRGRVQAPQHHPVQPQSQRRASASPGSNAGAVTGTATESGAASSTTTQTRPQPLVGAATGAAGSLMTSARPSSSASAGVLVTAQPAATAEARAKKGSGPKAAAPLCLVQQQAGSCVLGAVAAAGAAWPEDVRTCVLQRVTALMQV
jgi:hypothetical protein